LNAANDNLARYPVTFDSPAPCPDCLELAKAMRAALDADGVGWLFDQVSGTARRAALDAFIAERER